MKDWFKNWKFWLFVAAVVLAIVAVVLYLTIPAFAAFVKSALIYIGVGIACALAGFIAGYMTREKKG